MIADAVLLGLVGGLAALAFLAVTDLGTSLIWGDTEDASPFSGSLWWVAACGAGGLLVGLLRRWLKVSDHLVGAVGIIQQGKVDRRGAPAAILVSAVSLISGASMGPFDGGTRSGAALGSWLASRRSRDDIGRSASVQTGVAGSLGGMLAAPFTASILITEVHPRKPRNYIPFLVPNVTAAVVGSLVFLATIGSTFLDVYALDSYDLKAWHFLVAIALGLICAAAARVLDMLVKLVMGFSHRWIPSLPARTTIGGFAFGLMAVALPLTFGSGKSQMAFALDEAGSLSAGLLLAVVAGKLFTTAVCLGTGFIGGPVMPTLFLGGTLGLAAHELFPEIPLSVAFSCTLLAVSGASIKAPFTMLVMVGLTTGLGPVAIAPAGVAILVAYVARHGLRPALLERPVVDLPPAPDSTSSPAARQGTPPST